MYKFAFKQNAVIYQPGKLQMQNLCREEPPKNPNQRKKAAPNPFG